MRQLCNLIILLLISVNVLAVAPKVDPEHFLSADTIIYDSITKYINAKGHIIVISDGYIVTADSMLYDIENDELWAKGHVRVKSQNKGEKNKFQMDGDSVFFKNKFKEGVIKHFILYFGDNSLLVASLAKRVDAEHSSLKRAQYTACKICGKNPMWSVSAARSDIDLEKEKVVYHNAFFRIYGVPVLFIPYFAHPTPKAEPQSGFLLPSYNKIGFGVPIYYRPKDNLDVIFTPRIKNSQMFYETDVRYLTAKGTYNLNSSFTKAQLTQRSGEVVTKDSRLNRYYVDWNGEVKEKEFNYKVSFKRTSDKAYLKQFLNKDDAYLKSYVYADKVNGANFVSVESLYFQGLQKQDKPAYDPFILPEIRIKHVTPVFGDNTSIAVENNTINYMEGESYKVNRNALSLSLTHLHKTEQGHLLNFSGSNRFDWYHVAIDQTNLMPKNQTIIRAIPEVSVGWQYPLVKVSSDGTSTVIEPEVLLVRGGGSNKKNIKFDYIDSGAYNLTEENLFQANHYSGIDFHEYGSRFSYGLKVEHNTLSGYVVKGFIGKLDYLTSTDVLYKNANILGRASVNYKDTIEFYYNTRMSSVTHSPYREELGCWYDNKLIYANVNLVKLKPIVYYAYQGGSIISNPGINQVYFDTKYQINESWSVGADARFNISKYNKISAISRNIKMTYAGDCVKVALRFGRNYTTDSGRGIYKTNNHEFAISLKTLGSF